VPFPIADFERIVFFGAVGITGYLYQLVRLVNLEVCQQIQLFGLPNVLRGEVGHRLSLLPVGLGFRCLNDRIGAILDNRPKLLHMRTFVFLPCPKNIAQGTWGFQKCLTLFIRQVVVLQRQQKIFPCGVFIGMV